MEIVVAAAPEVEAARRIARRLRDAVRRRGRAALAVSGGSTAPPLFAALTAGDVPWEAVEVWQVDERIAPDGSLDRNAAQLAALPAARVRPMPVTAGDLRAAARRYAATLPERFDVVHLGIGADGHTASWPPGDPIGGSGAAVELTGEFNGLRRMTLTPGPVNGARWRLVLAVGAPKAAAVRRWLLRDRSLPVELVHRTNTVVVLDPGAAGQLPR